MNDLPPPMQSVWQSLLWKEWHEHKWRLAALLAIVIAPMIVFGIATDRAADRAYVFVGVTLILPLYCALSGIFLGMSTAGGESGRGTMPFLQSLPTARWRPGAAKLIAAALTAILPVLALIGVFSIWWTFLWFEGSFGAIDGTVFDFHSWGIENVLVATTLSCVLGVISFLLWTAAIGVNRSDEIRAGAIGFLVICIFWFAVAFSHEIAEIQQLPTLEHYAEVMFAASAGGVAFVGVGFGEGLFLDWWAHYMPYIEAAVIGHGCLLAWFLVRYGNSNLRPSRTGGKTLAAVTNEYQFLSPPRRSQWTAIAWKQIRETGPLAIISFAGIIVMSLLGYFVNERSVGIRDLGETMGSITMTAGFFITLVAGIGVFLEDLKPQLGDFWRSRPMDHKLWFGVKFVVGVALLAAIFGTLFLLILYLTGGNAFLNRSSDLANAGFLVGLSLVFLLIYTISMALYCVLRQPLYAAVFTIGLLVIGGGVMDFSDRYFHLSQYAGFAMLLLCQIAATVFAWQAVKRNWHWGSR